MNRIISTAAVVLTFILAQPAIANATEIHVWTARALATVLAEIGPQFERVTGHRLNVYSGLPVDFEKRASAGDPLDVLVSGSSPVDRWIREGKLVAETRTDIARSGIGVEVRAGARKPDISSVDAFKRALLDAKSIAYLRVGSGIYLHGLLERLGIAEAVKSKVTRPESDIVFRACRQGRGRTRHGRHHSDSDDSWPRAGWPPAAGDTVLRRVYGGRRHELKSAGRGQATVEIPYRADGHSDIQGPGHGAGALTTPWSRPP